MSLFRVKTRSAFLPSFDPDLEEATHTSPGELLAPAQHEGPRSDLWMLAMNPHAPSVRWNAARDSSYCSRSITTLSRRSGLPPESLPHLVDRFLYFQLVVTPAWMRHIDHFSSVP